MKLAVVYVNKGISNRCNFQIYTVEIKTAILGYTALSLCSHQPAAIGVEFACGQHCNPESGITGSASSVQGVVLFRDLKLRFWETDVAWRDVTDVFGF